MLLAIAVLFFAHDALGDSLDATDPGSPSGTRTVPAFRPNPGRTPNNGVLPTLPTAAVKEDPATVQELSDEGDQEKFLEKIADLRRQIIIRTLKKKLMQMTSGGDERKDDLPVPGDSRGGHRAKRAIGTQETPRSHARILGRAGSRVVAKIDGKTVEMSVGEVRDGYKVILSGGLPAIIPVSRVSPAVGPVSGKKISAIKKTRSSALANIKLLGTSHFYARISYRDEEREVGIGSIVASRYKVASIGRGSVVFEDIKTGQDIPMAQRDQPETLPSGLTGRPFMPPPPSMPYGAPSKKKQAEEDY